MALLISACFSLHCFSVMICSWRSAAAFIFRLCRACFAACKHSVYSVPPCLEKLR